MIGEWSGVMSSKQDSGTRLAMVTAWLLCWPLSRFICAFDDLDEGLDGVQRVTLLLTSVVLVVLVLGLFLALVG